MAQPPPGLIARALRPAPLAAGALAALAVAAAAPLATYSLALATLGAPHALSELRFVARRYAPGRPAALIGAVILGLAALAVGRLGQLAGAWGPPRILELGLALGLAALALPRLWSQSLGICALGLALIGAVAWGTAVAPTATLLAFAVLHNLTPLAFLAEAAGGPGRRRLLWGASLLFLGGPLLILSGLPYQALAALGLGGGLELAPLPSGPLAAQLGAFFPHGWHGAPWLVHGFAAVAFAQLMHHGAVLWLLPRLAPPPGRIWALGLLGLGALSLALFAVDFGQARALYGVLAAVHAWAELPVLLAALAGPLAPRLSQPPAAAGSGAAPAPR